MTRVFKVDKNNDLVIGGDANLTIANGIEAVLQGCEHAAKAQLSEMVLAVEQGVPNFQTAWEGAPNVAQFEAYLLRQLLAVDGVKEVLELSSDVVDNVLSYSVTISTIYGEGVING